MLDLADQNNIAHLYTSGGKHFATILQTIHHLNRANFCFII